MLWATHPFRHRSCIFHSIFLAMRLRLGLGAATFNLHSQMLEGCNPFLEINYAIPIDVDDVEHVFEDGEVGLGHLLLRLDTELIHHQFELLEIHESLLLLCKHPECVRWRAHMQYHLLFQKYESVICSLIHPLFILWHAQFGCEFFVIDLVVSLYVVVPGMSG